MDVKDGDGKDQSVRIKKKKIQPLLLLLLSVTFNTLQAAVDPMRILPGRAADKITLLHFNDCRDVEPRDTEPAGGAARFLTAVNSQKENNPLVLFSGNIFSPSKSRPRVCRNIILTVDCLFPSEHLHPGRADGARAEPARHPGRRPGQQGLRSVGG